MKRTLEEDSYVPKKLSRNDDIYKRLSFQLNKGSNKEDFSLTPKESQNKTYQSTPYPKKFLQNTKEEKECSIIIEKRSSEYLNKLATLNKAFVRWIDTYVNQGLNLDFTPVCNDYISFITKLRERFPEHDEPNKKNVDNDNVLEKFELCSSPNKKKISSVNFNFDNYTAPVLADKEYKSTPYPKFLIKENAKLYLENKVDDKNKELKKIDSLSNVNTINKNLFDIKPKLIDNSITENLAQESKPIVDNNFFSFENIYKSKDVKVNDNNNCNTDNNVKNEEEDGEYVPPKPEINIVNEESVYSTKCKLFFNKDSNYIEKGKGTLYIKLSDNESSNYTLLIRADNSLGTILLNIILKPSLPVKETKNGILLTCIPNPPLDDSKNFVKSDTATFYIRFKNNEVRDEMLEKIKEYSK